MMAKPLPPRILDAPLSRSMTAPGEATGLSQIPAESLNAFTGVLEIGILHRNEILRTVEGLDRRPLRDRRRVRCRLRLDRGHRLYQFSGTARITDAPARHAICLRYAVHRQRAIIQFWLDLRRGRENEVVV